MYLRRAVAQVDPWEFEVYPYATLPRGMIELETDNTVVPNGHSHSGSGTAKGTYPSQGMWYNAYELTYGVPAENSLPRKIGTGREAKSEQP
jgi:hypothetical protein